MVIVISNRPPHRFTPLEGTIHRCGLSQIASRRGRFFAEGAELCAVRAAFRKGMRQKGQGCCAGSDDRLSSRSTALAGHDRELLGDSIERGPNERRDREAHEDPRWSLALEDAILASGGRLD